MRPKVIHVITRMDLGGAQQNTAYTVTHLDERRFDALLVTGEGGILDPELQARLGPRLRYLSSLKREVSPGYDFLAFLQLLNLFLAEKPDIVHTHSSKAGILGRWAAWLASVPVVIHTYHGFGFHDYQRPIVKSVYVRLERLACRMSGRLIFVSHANLDYARRHGLGAPQQYSVIRSGVRLADFPAPVPDKAAKKASLGLGAHKPMIVSVGNLKPQKNPGDFVAMAQLAASHRSQPSFLFIGEGPLRSRLEGRVMASGLHGRLSLPGWRRDIPEILAAADIFVMTSLWEGLPRSLVEAMKTGLACVCYATDGVRDVLQDGENGFVIPPGDVSRMAERVSALLDDPGLRSTLGAKAAATIQNEFDIDGMVRAQERLYGDCLGVLPSRS